MTPPTIHQKIIFPARKNIPKVIFSIPFI